MARLEVIYFQRFIAHCDEGGVVWTDSSIAAERIPQLFWVEGYPWLAANNWLREQAVSGRKLSTVRSNGDRLASYAAWLEANEIEWTEFPVLVRDRCLMRYRGHLIKERAKGRLASSTAASRMRTVIAFYRWAVEVGYFSDTKAMWREKDVRVLLTDNRGVSRLLRIPTTDLSLSAPRKVKVLEGGVDPLDPSLVPQLVALAAKHTSPELYYMLLVGLFTGMRLGTICDLKVRTLEEALPVPMAPGMHRIRIGPRATPAVATKFDVTGTIVIPTSILNDLISYAHGRRRHRRALRGSGELLFITRDGRSYRAATDDGESRAVNVAMHRFRRSASLDAPWIAEFNFHQTRATYATLMARYAMDRMDVMTAVAVVREQLLHRDDATTLKYIKFIQSSDMKIELAEEFSRIFYAAIA